jgi:hypothetical protein
MGSLLNPQQAREATRRQNPNDNSKCIPHVFDFAPRRRPTAMGNGLNRFLFGQGLVLSGFVHAMALDSSARATSADALEW